MKTKSELINVGEEVVRKMNESKYYWIWEKQDPEEISKAIVEALCRALPDVTQEDGNPINLAFAIFYNQLKSYGEKDEGSC